MQEEQYLMNEPGSPDRQVQEEKPQAKPWGFWATIGFCCIIGVAYILTSIVVTFVFVIPSAIANPHLDVEEYTRILTSSGLFLSISIIAASPVIILLILLFAGIRKEITIKEYLSLNIPSLGQFFIWSFALILFVICSDALTSFLGRPIVPDFMINVYKTAYFPAFLWFAFVVVAPISEEFLMRGFLFKGIEYSKLGPLGAVVITSLVWSVLHIQYDFYGIASIFVGGLLVGWARLKTKSIYIPVAMHSLMNLIATVECAVVLAEK